MTEPPPPPPVTGSRWVVAIALVAVAAAALAALPTSSRSDRPSDPPGSSAMVAVAPGGTIDLTDLPEDHKGLYLAAAADREAFETVACYCGCETFLDHRHLLDCFVRPDGGWERHATGCAVCLAQARDVIGLRDAGTPLDEIRRTIDRRFGGIASNATT